MTVANDRIRIQLEAIPALNDNYIWCFRDVESPLTWVVDPGQATPVVAYLQANQLSLAAILLTHHHPDHTGGVRELIDQSWRSDGECPVFGNRESARPNRIPHINQALDPGQCFTAAGLTFETMAVPGHTLDHVAFFTETPFDLVDTQILTELERLVRDGATGPQDGVNPRPLLFCGDTLFSAGCGRLFEGTPEQMLNSFDSIAALPASTAVCCGHEYTLANLAFTADAWPDNDSIADYRRFCEGLRADGRPTLPSSLAIERSINPFMSPERTRFAVHGEKNVSDGTAGRVSAALRLQAFTRLRAAKDKA